VLQAGLFDDALTLLKKQEEKASDLNRLDRSGLALIHIACASGAMVNILSAKPECFTI
jgi:heme A synthase